MYNGLFGLRENLPPIQYSNNNSKYQARSNDRLDNPRKRTSKCKKQFHRIRSRK